MKKQYIVKTVSVEDKDVFHYQQYPIIVDNNWNSVRQSCVYELDSQNWLKFLPSYADFAHIQLWSEDDFLVATTQKLETLESCGVARIPKSFVDEYIRSNGSIETVWLEVEEQDCEDFYGCGECQDDCTWFSPKVNKNNEVIILPTKIEMKIEDIPIEEIKRVVNYIGGIQTPLVDEYSTIKKWFKDNNF